MRNPLVAIVALAAVLHAGCFSLAGGAIGASIDHGDPPKPGESSAEDKGKWIGVGLDVIAVFAIIALAPAPIDLTNYGDGSTD